MSPPVFLIYARAANGTIGTKGKLPWHLPVDLHHFKKLTMGKPMIMGRRTFQSFGKPLPGRRHIVLTRNENWDSSGAEIAHSADEALAIAGNGLAEGQEIAVVGGAAVYDVFRPMAERIELTEIHADYDGDTFMRPLGAEWVEVNREDYPADDHMPAYSFVSYRRATPDEADS